jgi:hypothetical protein
MCGLNHGKDAQYSLHSQVSSSVHTKASPVSAVTAYRHDEDLTKNYLMTAQYPSIGSPGPPHVYITSSILNTQHAPLLTLSSRLRISSASSSLISLRSPSRGVDSSRHSFFTSGLSASLSEESLGRLLPGIGRSAASPDFLLELSSDLIAIVTRK